MNILIRAYWGIGDVLLQTPSISMVRLVFPHAHIIHRTMEVPLTGKESILYGHPDVDELDPKQEPELDITLNLGGYDYVTMSELARYHRDFQHTHIFYNMVERQLEHKGIEISPELLPDADSPMYPELYLTSDDRITNIRTDKLIAVICRATKGCPQKTWPTEKWQELTVELKKSGYYTVAIGVDGDFHFNAIDLDLVGKLSFRQAAAVQTLADIYIGHGDGLIMSAYALHVPFVCIWGDFADPGHYFDLPKQGVRILGHLYEGCSYRFTNDYLSWLKRPCLEGTSPCINTVSVEEVMDAVGDCKRESLC